MERRELRTFPTLKSPQFRESEDWAGVDAPRVDLNCRVVPATRPTQRVVRLGPSPTYALAAFRAASNTSRADLVPATCSVPLTPRSIHPAFTASYISSAGPLWPFGRPNCSNASAHPARGIAKAFTSLQLPGALHVNSAQTYDAAALAALGLIQAPLLGIGQYLESGALVEIMPDFRRRAIPVSLVVAHRSNLSRRVRAFMNWIEDVLTPYLE
ncbi:LysR substrate-binding domain-containing protein [Rhizobium ruizarguesonis]